MAATTRKTLLPRLITLLLCGLAGLLLSSWLMSAFTPLEGVFQLDAESEYARGQLDIAPTHTTTHLEWMLHGAVFRGLESNGARLPTEPINARLSLRGPAVVEAERVANGSLFLALREAPGGSDQFAAFVQQEPAGRQTRLAPPVFIEIAAPSDFVNGGTVISLPFQATQLSIGREPNLQASGAQPILRSGALTILGRTFVERRVYVAKSTLLRGGDVVTLTGSDNSAKVLLRVDERPAIQAVARVAADSIAIGSFFTVDRYEGLNFFDIIANDRILIGIWSILAVTITLAGALVSRNIAVSVDAPLSDRAASAEFRKENENVDDADSTTLAPATEAKSSTKQSKGSEPC